MTTQTLIKKIDKKVSILQKDLELVKQMLVESYRDSEGEYRPAFVKKILKRMASEGPVYRFTTKKEFLRHVRSAK